MSGAVGRVLLSAWQARRNAGPWWPTAAILVVLLLLPLLAWCLTAPPLSSILLRVVGGIIVASIAGWAWSLLVFNILLQNEPRLARTVPAQTRGMRLALVVGAAMLALLGGALSALWGGSSLMAIVGAATVAAVIAAGLRWPLTWLVVIAVSWTLPSWLSRDTIRAMIALWQASPLLDSIVACVAATLVLRATIGTGGPAHERAHRRLQNLGVAMRSQGFGGAPRRQGGTGQVWAQRLTRHTYAGWFLRRLSRPAGVGSRLALGLGPQAHWAGILGGAVYVSLLLLSLVAASVLFPRWQVGQSVSVGLYIGLTGSVLTATGQMQAALWASRREQALLRLLPGAPQGAALNRWLALRLAGCVGVTIAWTLGAVLLARAMIGGGGPMPFMLPMALGVLALSPLQIALLWRDWSRLRAPGGSAQLFAALMLALLLGASAAWVAWLDAPWWGLLIVTALLLLPPLAGWRWRALSRAPVALPVGRL